MIPSHFIADLLARVDVVEVVGRAVQLKKAGSNFMGLCPFHGEKSPSFTVSPTKQFYHCFGCGVNGTAISFLMEYQGMGFVDAVEELARNAGMVVPQDTNNRLSPTEAAQFKQERAGLSDVLAQAGGYYRRQLRTSPRAIAYLKTRGLSGEIAAKFGLGYAPDAWQSLENAFPDYENPQLAQAGLVIVREAEDNAEARTEAKRYDRFRDRIMFPIRNPKGEVVGFGGRILDQGEPKYLNSPETPVFNKGSELYGLFEARQAIRERGYVLVTEGYMDVVALAQLGFPNAVATLGTATSGLHVQKLLRQTDHVVYSFDGDAAGRRAAWRALESALPFAADDKRLSFLFLPAEHDPDSFVREQGSAAFEAEVARAMPLSRFLINELSNRHELQSAEGRSALIKESAPLLGALPAGALKLQIIRMLADAAGLNPADIEGLTRLAEQKRQEYRAQKAGEPGEGKFGKDPLSKGNFRYQARLRTPRNPPTSLECKVIDALVRSPAAYAAVRDQLLIWRDQLGDPEQAANLNSLVNLITLFETAAEQQRQICTADLNAYAEQDLGFKQALSVSMRAEAVGAETADESRALNNACLMLQKEQLKQTADSLAAQGDVVGLSRIRSRLKAIDQAVQAEANSAKSSA